MVNMYMPKYLLLEKYLHDQTSDEVRMTFNEIEQVIGTKLPPSARTHRAWWSNNSSNSVMTRAWLNAGFRSEQVDLEQRKLVFRRIAARISIRRDKAMAEAPQEFLSQTTVQQKRHPMLGAMKGYLAFEGGLDLTQPAMPEWAKIIDEEFGSEPRK